MKRLLLSSAVGITISASILSLSGCRPDRIDSAWLKAAPTDLQVPDWQSLPGYRLDDLQGVMTVANDSTTLYVRLISHDRRLAMRLERNGMMVRLTGPHKATERLGIHYPLGTTSGSTEPPGRYLPDAGLSPEAMGEMLAMQNNDFEIMLGDSTIRSADAGGETERLGVRAQLAQTRGGHVEYTLTIRSGDLVPWIKPGACLRMDVESGAMKLPEMRDRQGFREHMRGPEGGMGPGGGGRGGMRGGRHGGRSGESVRPETGIPLDKPIHLELEILLATK